MEGVPFSQTLLLARQSLITLVILVARHFSSLNIRSCFERQKMYINMYMPEWVSTGQECEQLVFTLSLSLSLCHHP